MIVKMKLSSVFRLYSSLLLHIRFETCFYWSSRKFYTIYFSSFCCCLSTFCFFYLPSIFQYFFYYKLLSSFQFLYSSSILFIFSASFFIFASSLACCCLATISNVFSSLCFDFFDFASFIFQFCCYCNLLNNLYLHLSSQLSSSHLLLRLFPVVFVQFPVYFSSFSFDSSTYCWVIFLFQSCSSASTIVQSQFPILLFLSFLTFSVFLFDFASNLVSSSLLTIFSRTFIFRFRPFHAHLPLLSSYSTLASTTASTSKFSQYFSLLLYFFTAAFLIYSAFVFILASSLVPSRLLTIFFIYFSSFCFDLCTFCYFYLPFPVPYCSLNNFQCFCSYVLLHLSFSNF